MDFCSWFPYPSLCNVVGGSGSSATGGSSGLTDTFSDLLDLFSYLFSDNAAPDALQMAITGVRSAPVADLGLEAFVAIYQATFAVIILFALVVFLWRLVKYIADNAQSDEAKSPLDVWKILVVGAYLPGAVTIGFLLSELLVKVISTVFDALPGNGWEANITGGFHPDQFLVRMAGLFLSKVLVAQDGIYQFLIYVSVILAVIAYALSSGRTDGGMGRISRWIWAALIAALIFKPIVLFALALGGYVIGFMQLGDTFQGVAVVMLLAFCTMFWLFVFLAANSRIKTTVENRMIRVQGDVNSRQRGSDQSNQVATRVTHDNRVTNINNQGGKNGVRSARHAAVDIALPAAAARAATAIHPVAGTVIIVGHAFLKGRRPPP